MSTRMVQLTFKIVFPAILFLIAIFFFVSALFPRPALSQVGTSLVGYLWSDTVGWIDVNCLNTNSCGTNNFGLSMDGGGVVSGYAWSDHLGWISANASDVAGCPTAPCVVRLSGNALSGWLRALSGGTSQSGGWDGYIALNGAGYGITYSDITNFFSGFAWGDTDTGWVDSSQMRKACSPTYTCSGQQILQTNSACQLVNYNLCNYPQFCVNGSSACVYPQPTGTLSVNPKLVIPGKSTTVSWNVTGVSTTTSPCVLSSSRGTDTATGASGTYTATNIVSQTTFVLTCTAIDTGILTPYKLTATTSLVPNFVEQ
ncbi:MAG: hypothetical protein JWO50_120 [Candidatus Kaiserbacteria bacterium]|nr:hypothetical protein [Candidatus Kaiserbacteria bacterium]